MISRFSAPLPSAALDDITPREQNLAEWAFRHHRAQIYRYLLRRTGNHDEAEELTQRVFVDAAAALSSSNRPDSIVAWLYAVAERRFIDEIRRRGRDAQRLGVFVPDGRTEEPPFYGSRVAEAVACAVKSLPVEQRRVVVMKLFEERSFADIAQLMDTTEAACKMRFSRALARVRNQLSQEGIGP